MLIESVRLRHTDGTVQEFVPRNPAKEEIAPAPPLPQFREGDLVRNTGVHGPGTNAIGVVRHVNGTLVSVEWAGWRKGHDLYPECQTRHHPMSGWCVLSRDIEYAT